MSLYGETTKQYMYEELCILRNDYDKYEDFLADILEILSDMCRRGDMG